MFRIFLSNIFAHPTIHIPDVLLSEVLATLPVPATPASNADSTNPSLSATPSSHSDENPLVAPSPGPQHLLKNPAATEGDVRDPQSAEAPVPVTAKRGSVFGGANPTCPRCSKSVYFAEMIQGPGGSKYHKLCFRCSDCDKSLDSMNSCVTTENILLCKTCYSKKHGPVGFGCVLKASCSAWYVLDVIIGQVSRCPGK